MCAWYQTCRGYIIIFAHGLSQKWEEAAKSNPLPWGKHIFSWGSIQIKIFINSNPQHSSCLTAAQFTAKKKREWRLHLCVSVTLKQWWRVLLRILTRVFLLSRRLVVRHQLWRNYRISCPGDAEQRVHPCHGHRTFHSRCTTQRWAGPFHMGLVAFNSTVVNVCIVEDLT